MNAESGSASLLDYLAEKAGCMYISDLCHAVYREKIQDAVRQIQPQDYSVGQWDDAVTYLTKEKMKFETQDAAVDYILNMK